MPSKQKRKRAQRKKNSGTLPGELQNIDFTKIATLEFANEKNANALICRTASLPLFENDACDDVFGKGKRLIEEHWNDLGRWLNDAFIYAFLCLLASKSDRITFVFDPILTDPAQIHSILTTRKIYNATFNFSPNSKPELILIPLYFASHWTILIHDSKKGTFFLDSLAQNPHRLHENNINFHATRVVVIRQIIAELTQTPTEEIEIQAVEASKVSQQTDGNSCGFFVCLLAEAWLFNNSETNLGLADIDSEKKRILWHLNELYKNTSIQYHCRYSNPQLSLCTSSSLMSTLNLSDTPRTSRSCNDQSAEPPCKRARTEIAPQASLLDSSQNASNILFVETPKKIQRSGGRPKKKSGGPGRPKKSNENLTSPKIPDQIKSNDVEVQAIENVIMNKTAEILPINFHSMNTLELPIGPALPQNGRVAPAQLLANRDEIRSVWADGSEFCADYMIYAFQRWIASKIQDKHVAVLEPFFTQNFGPDTLGLDPLDFCFNYSENYDVLLITVMYPAHFTLIIFDRTSQPPKCIFVDPLPPVLNENCPFTDRLYDIRYPGYDQNRLSMLSETICRLTPGIQLSDFSIRIATPDEFTPQRDGINCGFFVALYSESYLTNNRSLLLPNLNIGVERRRILWILSQLLLTNDVPNVPREEYPIIEEAHHTPIRGGAIRVPILPTTPLRRSPRLSSLSTSRETSVDKNSATTDKTASPITRRCHQRHSDYVCTDVRAKHAPEYYDSGNLGDKTCAFCSAILFESEAKVKYGQTSSFNCCNFGAIQLPPIEQPPPLLKRLSTEDSAEAKEYRAHQNAYNSLLAFASISVGHKENTSDGAVCFMLNGEFVRRMSSICAGQLTPSFSQLFILDPAAAVEHRKENVRYGGARVSSKTLTKLDFILRKYHPLAKQLMNFHQQFEKKLEEEGPDSVHNFRLTLLEARMTPANVVDANLHSRQTNIPNEGTMFAVWTETERPPVVSGIWITTAEGELSRFPPYHPLTDTLCYPLLIPRGDDGYHNQLTIKKSKKRRNGPPIEDDDLALNITKKQSKIMAIDDEDADSANNIDIDDHDSQSMPDSEATDSDTSMDLQSDDGSTDQTTKMSLRSFVKYRMAIREGQEYHFIWSAAGGLSQKLILDYSARIDADIANFLRRPELDLRGTLPEHLLRWFARNAGLSSVEEIGSVVLFRKTQPGTRAYFQDMYYDATTIMARVRQPRNACFMLTWTCNPHWPEIKRNFLRVDQKVVDRFDILCRVYEDKLRHVHELLDKKNIFGKQLGFAESREFQKRIGGPHLHRIFQSTILALPENIENVIWAHIPAEPLPSDTSNWANFMRKVRELIQKYQLHDCGSHCRNLKGQCSKGFPKSFSKHTILFDDKPAVYRRPSPEDGGETLTVKRKKATIVYDNSRVVPFNPFLLVLTETHHNMEYAYGKSTNLKYALKYEFKGASFSYVKSTEENKTNVDEPAFYAKMLYRSPVEAFSRIMSYRYACLSHTVYALSIHLPGKQKIYVRPGQNAKEIAEQLLNNEIQLPETPLTSYWKQWRADPALQNVLFEKMPEKYSFDKLLKIWKKRKISTDPKKIEKRRPILGRIYPILPRAQELFALYILTKHFPGDPEHLKDVNGHQCATFLEAARLRGLIKDSNVWIRTLEEGAASLNPAQMRQLFASILLFGNTEDCVIDALMLWNRFLSHMYDTRCSDQEKPLRIERALCLLERILVMQGRQCSDFGLPTPQNSIINHPEVGVNDFFFPQHLADDDTDETVDTSKFATAQLNEEQTQFFDTIQKVSSVSPNNTTKRLFFLSGDGGTGKTFLLNYLLFRMRKMGKKVIATASTGMAATRFYAGGTTVHAAFRLGITVEPGKIPPITFDSFFGRRIIEAEVVIIDEITMLHKVVLENIDLICRTLIPRYAHLPFSGKIVILSGDWKQSLPVVSDSYCVEAQVAACVQSSPLYELFEKVKLVENMRVNQQDVEFISWLQKVGTGEFGETVPVPKEWIVSTRDELVASVFEHGFAQTSNELLKRLMLATTNRIVDLNNASILSTFNSEYKDYYSDDTPLNEGTFAVNAADFDVGQINLLSPPGMPAHQIRLKVGSIIVLLLNLNTSKALCNGTRLIVKKMTDNLIHAEALTVAASRSGIEVFIPRVSMTFKGKRPDDVNFERFQFPVRVAFTMTVTKAQGQTCDHLGIDFTEESFAHGQTYTAFSRATSANAIRVYAPNKPTDESGNILVRNIVASGVRFD